MSHNKVIRLASQLSSIYLSKKAVDITEMHPESNLFYDAKESGMKVYFLMEEDLFELRLRGLKETGVWNALAKLREEILTFIKGMNKRHPHDGLRSLLAYIEKEMPTIMKMLQLIDHELAQPIENFPQKKSKGIPALLDFLQKMENILETQHAQLGSTVPPPRMGRM